MCTEKSWSSVEINCCMVLGTFWHLEKWHVDVFMPVEYNWPSGLFWYWNDQFQALSGQIYSCDLSFTLVLRGSDISFVEDTAIHVAVGLLLVTSMDINSLYFMVPQNLVEMKIEIHSRNCNSWCTSCFGHRTRMVVSTWQPLNPLNRHSLPSSCGLIPYWQLQKIIEAICC